MPCLEIFEQQSSSYKNLVLGSPSAIRVSIEAGSKQGWHQYTGVEGIVISVDTFGDSDSPEHLAHKFGFTVEKIINKILD